MNLPHFRYECVTSTNDCARELLRDYPAVFVSALYQYQGRGRHGRSWVGDFGKNVYCSLGLRHRHPPSPSEAAALLALGAVAVWETVTAETHTPSLFLLKYPNDLLGRCPDGVWRKLSGVLVEHIAFPQNPASVIGIGINVQQTQFPPSLRPTATSLALMGFELTPEALLQRLYHTLQGLLPLPPAELLQRWRSLLQLEGRLVALQGQPGLWRVRALRDDGSIELEHNGKHLIATDGDSLRYLFA